MYLEIGWLSAKLVFFITFIIFFIKPLFMRVTRLLGFDDEYEYTSYGEAIKLVYEEEDATVLEKTGGWFILFFITLGFVLLGCFMLMIGWPLVIVFLLVLSIFQLSKKTKKD